MYPLVQNFIPPIDAFLEKLHRIEGIKVETNHMSTQIYGPSDVIFRNLNCLVEEAYAGGQQYSFVIKVLNGDVSENAIPDYKE